MQDRVQRELARRDLIEAQVRAIEAERRRLLRESESERVGQVRRLMQLDGIGVNNAWVYVMEFFGWRSFRNRREVASLAGLTPTLYDSGNQRRERGISKAGNRRIRAMAIEIAWGWLRFQPDSELARWYERRFGSGGSRLRKIGIVALARKLLIAVWRFVETGEVPAGATLKTT